MAILLVASWLAWSMARLGLARHFAPTRPGIALSIAPGFPDALLAAAEPRLTHGRPGEAAELARRVIANDPLDVSALRVLGMALERTEGPDAAEVVLNLAVSRTFHDTQLAAWILRRRIIEGRAGPALDQADALLRRDIDAALRDRLEHFLAVAAGDEATRPVLVARMAARPEWRDAFLQRLVATSDPTPGRAVLLALATGPAPPTPSEYGPYVERLIAARRYGLALADWRAVTGRSETVATAVDFAGDSDGTAFTWSKTEGAGAESDFRNAPGRIGGRALHVAYDGFAAPALPRRLLVLPPGHYRLSAMAYLESGEDDGRLRWTVACADRPLRLGRSDPSARRGAWREMTLSFEAPSEGCGAQWLELTAEPGDRPSARTIWYARPRLESTR